MTLNGYPEATRRWLAVANRDPGRADRFPMSNDSEHGHSHDHTGEHSHDHGIAGEHGHEHGHEHEVAPTWMPGVSDLDRQAARWRLAGATDEALDDLFDESWHGRRTATELILAITEEKIARLVTEQHPTATEIVLYEDYSHDSPHAHVLDVRAGRTVLVSGTGDDWHDQSWTGEVDEFVWDLHHLDRAGFTAEGHLRTRHIPILPALAPAADA